MKTKIFCIGFHKTGTTSLAEALKLLGYRVTGPNGVNDPNIEQNALKMALKLVPKYDAFQDNPWPLLYKELDAKFPNSKFILTLRNSETWINSQVNHFGFQETPMRKLIYGVGCPQGNENVYVNRYSEHNAEVKNYFKDRSADLLRLDIAKGDGWVKLCQFLGISIPDCNFPHVNRISDRRKNILSKSIKVISISALFNRFKKR